MEPLSPTRAAIFPAVAGFLLAAAALSTGALAAFAAALPVWGLAAQAVAVRRGPDADTPRRVVGAGAVATLLAAGLALFGAGGLGGLALLAGLACMGCGARLALARVHPPADTSPPSASDLGAHTAAAADELLLAFAEASRRVRRAPPFARLAADVRAAADRNVEQGWFDHPERAHPPPPPLAKPTLERRHLRGAGDLEHLRFSAEYEPPDPEVRAAYLSAHANRTAHVYLCRHVDGPRPTLICIHGTGLGAGALDWPVAWNVRWLHEHLGLDLAIAPLPLQGPRAVPGIRGPLDGHPLWTSAALGQAIWELRQLSGWLRAAGAPTLGVFGMSLGGTVAALFASLEGELACAVPVAPVAVLEALAWRLMPPVQRAQARAAGLTEHRLERAWARHAPLRLRPGVPHPGRLVVGGLADRISPPEEVGALWEHWGRPGVHWYPGSHLVWAGRGGLRNHVDVHLRETLLGPY